MNQNIENFRIWNDLEYGIFETQNILENGIFLNMEYLEDGKEKRNNLL